MKIIENGSTEQNEHEENRKRQTEPKDPQCYDTLVHTHIHIVVQKGRLKIFSFFLYCRFSCPLFGCMYFFDKLRLLPVSFSFGFTNIM
jgi:hypothetical protein